jgi:hypothetical protein
MLFLPGINNQAAGKTDAWGLKLWFTLSRVENTTQAVCKTHAWASSLEAFGIRGFSSDFPGLKWK